MGSSAVLLPKLNDRDVIRAFRSIAEGTGAIPTFSDALGQVSEDEAASIAELTGFNLKSAVISLHGASWHWARLRGEDGEVSAKHDRLTFNFNDQNRPDRATVLQVSTKLEKALWSPIARARTSEEAAPIASHSQVLTEMQSVAAELIESTAHYRQQLDDAYLQKETTLTQRIDDLRERELERISAERARVESELAGRTQALDQQKQDLDVRQKSLDDRNNTHVRRQIRESLLLMTKDRLENFTLSRETRKQHLLVNIIVATGLALSIVGAIAYSIYIASAQTQTIFYSLVVKSSILAATAIALGYWYIGWQNRWLQRLADAEFRLQQFRLDIERASWLAETVLEWKQTSEEPIPELLVTRLSNGLFQAENSESNDPKSPATHLAEALFGASTAAKIKLGDQELHFDRRSIKRLEE